jgi:MFS family permease
MALPVVLRDRPFVGYLVGVIFSQIGARGAVAANLYQVYALSGSVSMTGLVGAVQGVAILGLSPVGGVMADRMDRRRLLQAMQVAAMLVALVLAVLTLTDTVTAWHVIVASLLTTAASTIDNPTRNALVAAMVPRHQLPQAVALLNPSREIAVLVGPGLAGLLIAVGDAGLVYIFETIAYAGLIIVLAFVRVPSTEGSADMGSMLTAILDGAKFVAQRRIIWMLMSLDLSAVLFGAYRVVLPALAVDVLGVGPAGYGLLAAAPSAGALLATYSVVKVVSFSRRLGAVLLVSTVLFGVADILLAQSRWFVLSIIAAIGLGAADAMSTTIRHSAVQLETPDALRGRVNSIYQMSSRGGPAVGNAVVGGVAGLLGPVTALTVGALVTIAYAAAMMSRPNVVRSYTGPEPEPVGSADAA